MAEFSSLIPKSYPKRLVETQERLGLLMFLAVVLFALSLLAWGGTFFYKRLVTDQIAELTASLERLEAEFEPPLIQELSRVSKAVEASKQLLSGHRSFSRAFQFLEDNTIPTVRFASFGLNTGENTLRTTGVAASYTDLALQSEAFSENSLVRSVNFSNLVLNSTGGVDFTLEIILDPSILSFR